MMPSLLDFGRFFSRVVVYACHQAFCYVQEFLACIFYTLQVSNVVFFKPRTDELRKPLAGFVDSLNSFVNNTSQVRVMLN